MYKTTYNIVSDYDVSLFKEPQLNLFRNYNTNINVKKDTIDSVFERILEQTYLGNGNCIDLFKNIKDSSIDFILTDPPYNLGEFMHKRNTNLARMRENHFAFSGWDDLPYDLWVENMDSFFKESSRTLKKSGALIVFMSLIKIETIIKIATKYKFYYKTTGIWHKTNPMPRNMNLHFVNSTEAWLYFVKDDTTGTFNNNGEMYHDFFETSLTNGREKEFGKHPTQKPIKLLNEFINLLSNEGDVVLDPFMGSGSSGVASVINNRKFIGFELNEEYYNISKNRILATL